MTHPGVEDEVDHAVCTKSLHHIRQPPWLAVTDVSKQRVMPKLPNSSRLWYLPLIAWGDRSNSLLFLATGILMDPIPF